MRVQKTLWDENAPPRIYRSWDPPEGSSAVTSTLFWPNEATAIGISSRKGWVIIFSGFPNPVPCPSGKGI